MPRYRLEWDEAKREANRVKYGVDFRSLGRFDWAGAWTRADARRDYGEPRYIAYAMLDGRLHAVAFTPRGGVYRIISLRRANSREQAAFQAQVRRRRL